MRKNLALLLLTLLVCLALAEVGARLLLPAQPVYRVPQSLHDPSPTLGWVLHPNQDAYTHDRPVHVNAEGMRDPDDVPLRKPPGELRILVLGDSLTYGNGVDQPAVYSEVLERALRERGLAVRSLNTGVQGYDTHQEAAYLAERGLGFDPDLVVVGFFANDLSPLPTGGFNDGRIDGQGQVHFTGLRGLFSDQVVYALKRLRIFAFLAYAAGELRWRYFPPPDDFWVDAIYKNVQTPISLQAWADVKTSLGRIRDLAASRGIETVLLALPLAGQLEPDASTAGYQDHLHAIASELGLEIVDPLEAMRAAQRGGTKLFLDYDGHPSAAGHRVVAEELVAPVQAALERHHVAPPVPGADDPR